LVEANVSEKRAVSIFSAEYGDSKLRLNLKEHNQNRQRRENFKSHKV
jgi:hypothetical protein